MIARTNRKRGASFFILCRGWRASFILSISDLYFNHLRGLCGSSRRVAQSALGFKDPLKIQSRKTEAFSPPRKCLSFPKSHFFRKPASVGGRRKPNRFEPVFSRLPSPTLFAARIPHPLSPQIRLPVSQLNAGLKYGNLPRKFCLHAGSLMIWGMTRRNWRECSKIVETSVHIRPHPAGRWK